MRLIGLLLLGLPTAIWARHTATDPTVVPNIPANMGTSVGSDANPGSVPLKGVRIITRANQGQTLHLVVGETFILRLAGVGPWEVQITDPRVIVTLSLGEQAVYRAQMPGVAELLAVAPPPCTGNQPPCRAMVPAFRAVILVR